MKPTNPEVTLAVLKATRDTPVVHINYLCFAIPAAARQLWFAVDDDVLRVNASRAAKELVGYIRTDLLASPHLGRVDADCVVAEDCLPPDLQIQVHSNLNQQDLIRRAWLDAMIRDLETNGELP